MKPSATKSLFLPYQVSWIDDRSRFKLWEKSRRIGATWVQAFEDVRDCISKTVPAVWFSSADESAAREYIRYCVYWAKLFNVAFRELGESVMDDKGVKNIVLEFSNNTRIHALSSNPTAFRSKGGKVVIDEFAFHKNDTLLWAAAKPVVTWGYPVRIISTHNGKNGLYYKFIEQIRSGKLEWSHHNTNIHSAVNQGLLDKIYGRKTTFKEREEWLRQEQQACGSSDIWQQEYCCTPIDESTAFIPYQMLDKVARPLELNDWNSITSPLYVGVDIARKRDFTVIWGIMDTGAELVTCIYQELSDMKFKDQEVEICNVLRHPQLRRACMDSTGIGMQMVENTQELFGKQLVEGVTFTSVIKETMAYRMKSAMENLQLLIPDHDGVRGDFHSIKRSVTSAGNIRFDAKRTEDGHADRFWAAALALHAAGNRSAMPAKIYGRKKAGNRLYE